MNKALTYSQLLLDPRWQRCRLEVFQRDGWRCRNCRTETRQLHAHHVAYLKGRAPWEYEQSWLVSLCGMCHDAEHQFGDSGWAHARVTAVNAGAIGATGQDHLARTVGRVLNAAAEHGFDAVSDALDRLENILADDAADRLDFQRGEGDGGAHVLPKPAARMAGDLDALGLYDWEIECLKKFRAQKADDSGVIP
jgi:hypothetical protein